MSKSTTLWGALIAIFLLASGCEKDVTLEPEFNEQSLRGKSSKQDAPLSKQFKMSARTWYRISPTTPAALPELSGQVAFAHVPGAGTGTATNMGNVGIWFNQLAYSPDGQDPRAGTVAAPLVEASSYSSASRGAPLPAVQPDDLRSLATLTSWLQIPATVNEHIVWSVIYNQAGDAVFLAATTPSVAVNESATRTSFSAEGIFVGGRGKYEKASGTYRLTGFFNPQDANDAGYNIDGDIIF